MISNNKPQWNPVDLLPWGKTRCDRGAEFRTSVFPHIQMKGAELSASLPRPQVSRTRRPVVDGQDVKVLLQREALKHQLYPVVLRCHDHPRAVGVVGVAVRVAGALYRPVGTV